MQPYSSVPYRKQLSPLALSLWILGIDTSLTLCYWFISGIVIGIMLPLTLFVLLGTFMWSLIRSCRSVARDNGRKPLLINLLTPMICVLLIGFEIPTYFNFYAMYSARMEVVENATLYRTTSTYESSSLLAPMGIEVDEGADDLRVRFVTYEEMILSDDPPPGAEIMGRDSYGYEYSREGFDEDEGGIRFGKHWRFAYRAV